MSAKQKPVMYSFLATICSVIVVFFGVISSGAGHGPFPRLSLAIAFLGVLVFIFSLVMLVVSIFFNIRGKKFSTKDSAIKTIPDYNWRCPKCDEVVKANNGDCKQCGFSVGD